MNVQISPPPGGSFTSIARNQFFAKNMRTHDNLEFIIEIHFEYEVLSSMGDHEGPLWERMRVSAGNQKKLQFFADTVNELFSIINRIVDIEQNGSIWKLVLDQERAELYKRYDEICERTSGEWITVHGRW